MQLTTLDWVIVIVSIALVTMMSLIAQDARELTGGSSGLRVPPISADLDRTSRRLRRDDR